MWQLCQVVIYHSRSSMHVTRATAQAADSKQMQQPVKDGVPNHTRRMSRKLANYRKYN